jgi:hypothetical protein
MKYGKFIKIIKLDSPESFTCGQEKNQRIISKEVLMVINNNRIR